MGRRALLLAVVVMALAGGGVAAARPLTAAHTARRCGRFSSTYGPIGVYVVKGQVSCATGIHQMQNGFAGRAQYPGTKPVDNGNESLYEGWTCGGQMGFYFCSQSRGGHVVKEVDGRGCTIMDVGCPTDIHT
ncbi:MAG TPA: hypothetical protein VHX88_00960 [Solirubrobacteraceae bacterium]|jgi:hypothetical protein|nr:hypothetical protein [Solirubrobacteraceae bacterium]